MSKPFFSVLMPVYNGAKFFDRSIKSVLAQSCGDFELIALDDCSADDSLAKLNSLAQAEPRIRVLTHDANRGSIETRIDLINAANGEYIAWLDQDDEYAPDFLSRARELIAAKNCDIVHFSHLDIAANGEMTKDEFAATEKSGAEVLDWFFQMPGNPWYIWDKVARASLWQKKLPPQMRADTDDVFFTLPLFFYATSYVAVDEKPMYTYYRDIGQWGNSVKSGSLTLNKYKSIVNTVVRYYRYNYDFLQEHGLAEKYDRDLIRLCYLTHILWRAILLPTVAERDVAMWYFAQYFDLQPVPRPREVTMPFNTEPPLKLKTDAPLTVRTRQCSYEFKDPLLTK